jgi:ABC-type xylose transport system permease subunit
LPKDRYGGKLGTGLVPTRLAWFRNVLSATQIVPYDMKVRSASTMHEYILRPVAARVILAAVFLGLLANCAGRIETGDIVHASGKLIYDSLKTARESERRPYFD